MKATTRIAWLRSGSKLLAVVCVLTLNLSAGLLDLTTAGSSATGTAALGGSFLVQQIPDQSTGTGVIDPFLRLQANGAERGFNTSENSPPLDDKAGIWTHALSLSNIPIVAVGGVSYRQFMLDINQNSGSDNEFLSLNQIQIFTGGAAISGVGSNVAYTIAEAAAGSQAILGLTNGTEIFRMNNLAGTNQIKLDYSLNSGSGSGDMFLYIANALFGNSTNVVLFSQFGTPPGSSASNDGFEEWATLRPAGSVPEPTSVVLFGTVLAGVGMWLRKRVDVNV